MHERFGWTQASAHWKTVPLRRAPGIRLPVRWPQSDPAVPRREAGKTEPVPIHAVLKSPDSPDNRNRMPHPWPRPCGGRRVNTQILPARLSCLLSLLLLRLPGWFFRLPLVLFRNIPPVSGFLPRPGTVPAAPQRHPDARAVRSAPPAW